MNNLYRVVTEAFGGIKIEDEKDIGIGNKLNSRTRNKSDNPPMVAFRKFYWKIK